MCNSDLKSLASKLYERRASIIRRFPFFGRLMLNLSFGFADCETAYTDMQRIVFDPAFLSELCDEEIDFVLLHELFHCAFKHCILANGKLLTVYNIACDIVVNSHILEITQLETFTIDSSPVMHLAPDGKEGRLYSAEQVYKMLIEKISEGKGVIKLGDITVNLSGSSQGENGDSKGKGNGEGDGEYSFDNHDNWNRIENADRLDAEWDNNLIECSKSCSYGNIPGNMKRILDRLINSSKVDWKYLLRSYIQFDRHDFTFSTPDKRYSGDFVMPSFQLIDGTKVENIWFLVDTSGSISNKQLAETYNEILNAIEQFDSLRGLISFFDTKVTEPVEFDSTEQLMNITPVGGGGTSFRVIFSALKKYFENELPSLIIILTDGYAPFPDESAALGVDVIWIITDSDEQAPWGECIHIDSSQEV